jgi:hypothetical protein
LRTLDVIRERILALFTTLSGRERILLLFLTLLTIAAVVACWRRRRSLTWPTTEAKVVYDPQSGFVRWWRRASRTVPTVESAYCLEWTVDGHSYRRRLDNRLEVDVFDIPVWEKPPTLAPQRIRYNPRNPSQCFIVGEERDSTVLAVVAVLTLVAYCAFLFAS